jgi:hypothetical protein
VNSVVATRIFENICKIYSRADSKTGNVRINQTLRHDFVANVSAEKQ